MTENKPEDTTDRPSTEASKSRPTREELEAKGIRFHDPFYAHKRDPQFGGPGSRD